MSIFIASTPRLLPPCVSGFQNERSKDDAPVAVQMVALHIVWLLSLKDRPFVLTQKREGNELL